MGVVFFPSLPFMGVMLFPSFVLGNVSEKSGKFLLPLSLFYILLSLPLLSSLSFSLSFSLPSFLFFFPHLIIPFFFLFFFFSSTSHSSFFLSFRTNSFHPFFLLLLFSTSFSFPLSLLRVFFLGNCLYYVFSRCNG